MDNYTTITNFKVKGIELDNYLVNSDMFISGNMLSSGDNSQGQLGDNTVINQSSPIQTIINGINWKQAEYGWKYSIALKTNGTIWGCGLNDYGQLGDNTTINKSSPVQIIAGNNWKSISCGYNTTAAIKSDGSLWLWGYNTNGQLGNNNAPTPTSSPVQTSVSGNDWKQVSCGAYHTAAIKTDGTLWIWGFNNSGQLGDNTTIDKITPIQTAASGTDWKQVSCCGDNTVAIKTDGTLWGWGANSFGKLGTFSITGNQSSPVQTCVSGTDWKSVSCGHNHTVAIKTDGTLWGFGLNDSGQLGDNTTINQSSPIQTAVSGTDWKQVDCGTNNTVAIKTDGTLWGWGINNSGQLGDNTIINKSIPTQIIILSNIGKHVSASEYNTIFITE